MVSSGPNKVARGVLHLYTDACFEPGPKAGIGGVLVDENGSCLKYFGTWLDSNVIGALTLGDRETIILELESFAVLAGIQLFQSELCGHDIVIFRDKNSVMASFISGKSANDLVALIVNLTFKWEDRVGAVLWHERVPSHSNTADGPSRGCFQELLGQAVDAGGLSEVVMELFNQCMSGVKGISNSKVDRACRKQIHILSCRSL